MSEGFAASSSASYSVEVSSRSVSSAGASAGAGLNQVAQDLLSLVGGVSGSASVSAVQGGATASGNYISEIEAAILRSTVPIEINESEEITVLGQRGVWANRAEVVNWRGVVPITEYVINEDANPEVITKRVQQQLEYVQELAIRYLRPPSPPAPGEIFIQQEANTLTPPAPPLVIRQQPPRPDTPEPLVIREAPPEPPKAVGRKVITISGKRIPPPPRKVVIERLAPLPAKPQSVLVERWLPYSEVKRRVVFQKSNQVDPQVVRPRNVIVQWEAPSVNVRKEVKYLGVVRANPVEYVQRYGASLKVARDLPQFVLDIKTPEGIVLAADYRYNELHELEGDLQALGLIDLDREGLGEYRSYLIKLGVLKGQAGANLESEIDNVLRAVQSDASVSLSKRLEVLVERIFALADKNGNGSIGFEEAEQVFRLLNARLGRNYGAEDVRSFISALDLNNDGQLDLNEFKRAFLNVNA